jgi:hypothetical protein
VVQAAAPLELARSSDAVQLARVVRRLRLWLGLERLLRWLARGAALSAAVAIAVSIGAWLSGVEATYWAVVAPIAAALVAGLVKWPDASEAARVGDRRLGLEERIATAVELTRRAPAGRFDALQVRDALAVTQRTGARNGLHADRREIATAIALGALAVASLALPNLQRPTLAMPSTALEPAMQMLTEDDARARTELTEPQDLAPQAEASAIAQPAPDPDLANRVQLEQAERDALDRLAKALGNVSAGQPAADAIQRGDFSSAKDLLSQLADEADQLSEAAKQQLAQSLQQAARATASTDKALADRERAAATALSKNNYNEQRQALRNLADQLEKSGARSATDNQLARDVGRLQQQQNATQGQANGAQPNGASNAQSAQSSAGQASATDGGAPSQGGLSDQGGAGVGTGPGGDALGDRSTQLESAGQTVEVPTKLGSGPGVRPTDGNEDQLGNDPTASGRSVAELIQTQQTGQVAPEQNLVPGEQRPVVRGYFH